MQPLAKFIEQLENDIIKQNYLLDNYIGQKDWRKAGQQQEYINGLNFALHLARTNYTVTDRVKNAERRNPSWW
jgi:hypothetical protein